MSTTIDNRTTLDNEVIKAAAISQYRAEDITDGSIKFKVILATVAEKGTKLYLDIYCNNKEYNCSIQDYMANYETKELLYTELELIHAKAYNALHGGKITKDLPGYEVYKIICQAIKKEHQFRSWAETNAFIVGVK